MARSRGRAGRASGPMPAAIAPEDTKTTSRSRAPSGLRQAASASTSASMRVASIAPPGVVSEEDPAFTTTRRALVIAVRISVPARGAPDRSRSSWAASRPCLSWREPAPRTTAGTRGRPRAARPCSSEVPWVPPAVEPAVGAPAAQTGLASGEYLGLPVEHDRLLLGADEHGRAGLGARLGQAPLDAEPGQPVGQVPG